MQDYISRSSRGCPEGFAGNCFDILGAALCSAGNCVFGLASKHFRHGLPPCHCVNAVDGPEFLLREHQFDRKQISAFMTSVDTNLFLTAPIRSFGVIPEHSFNLAGSTAGRTEGHLLNGIPAWFEAARFGRDIQVVMALRMMRLAVGGLPAAFETWRMVSEKYMTLGEANWAALTTMASGGSVQTATRKNYKLYRRRVRANRRRMGA
ncbi:MAG: hypothetical protein WAM76_08040 [Pseudolabrys sp.]